MSFPTLYWHDVVCVQITPSQQGKYVDGFGRTLLIRGKTWDGNLETFRIELYGQEEIQVLQGGTAEELAQAADELLYQRLKESDNERKADKDE